MKRILLTLSMSLIAVFAFSQAKVEVGVKAGANFSKVGGKNISGNKNLTSFHAGAYGTFKLSSIAIQPELIYSAQGTKSTTGNTEVKTKLGYLNVPVLVKYYLPGGFNVYAGPQLGLLLSAKANKVDVKNSFKGTDFAGVIGIGWDAPMGLNVSARYNHGFTNINKNSGNAKPTNRSFQVSVGYTLFKAGN